MRDLAIIFVMVLFGATVLYGTGGLESKPYYMSHPTGAYTYTGEIKISANVSIPEKTTVPYLTLTHKNYGRDDAIEISKDFGIINGDMDEFPEYYSIHDGDQMLTVFKNGYQIVYLKENVPIKTLNMSDDELANLAEKYLQKYSKYLPRGITYKIYDIIDDRFESTADDYGNVEEVYYTKRVIYNCYFNNEYFVGIRLSVEIDADGNLAGFISMPIEIKEEGTINIKKFSEIYKWMTENGVPVDVNPKLIKYVEITDVVFGYLPKPTTFGAKFEPAYLVKVRVVGIDAAVNSEYVIDIGGITL